MSAIENLGGRICYKRKETRKISTFSAKIRHLFVSSKKQSGKEV
jgi:hypothetical protein